MSDAPNGSWMDKWGACRVCGGELPHGHSNNCDYYKLELEARAAKQKSELASPAGSHSDTDRLNFLLRFFSIEDVGDDTFFAGVCIDRERLEEALTIEPNADSSGRHKSICNMGDDLRAVIDRAINANE